MRQFEGLCSLQHGKIKYVFPSVPLPAFLLIIGSLFEVKGLKVDLFLFPRKVLYQIQSLVPSSLSSSLAV